MTEIETLCAEENAYFLAVLSNFGEMLQGRDDVPETDEAFYELPMAESLAA